MHSSSSSYLSLKLIAWNYARVERANTTEEKTNKRDDLRKLTKLQNGAMLWRHEVNEIDNRAGLLKKGISFGFLYP